MLISKSISTYNAFNLLCDDIEVQNGLAADHLLLKVHIPYQIHMTVDNIFWLFLENRNTKRKKEIVGDLVQIVLLWKFNGAKEHVIQYRSVPGSEYELGSFLLNRPIFDSFVGCFRLLIK